MSYPGVKPPRRRIPEVLALVVVLGTSVVAAGFSVETQNQVESAVRATVLYPFLQLHRSAAEWGRIEQRNRLLVAEQDSLTELLMRYRTRGGIGGAADADGEPLARRTGSATPAVVYPGRPYIGDPDVFVLTGSDLSGLEFPVGVFTGLGLVGVARAPHGRGASGEFWSHADFRVSVVDEGGRVSGFVRALRPEGGQPVMLLEGAPFQADVPAGTLLITTGIGAIYPPGLPVGRVREVAQSEAGWMRRYLVEPAVRPERVGDVFVWERPEIPAESALAPEAAPPTEAPTDEPNPRQAGR